MAISHCTTTILGPASILTATTLAASDGEPRLATMTLGDNGGDDIPVWKAITNAPSPTSPPMLWSNAEDEYVEDGGDGYVDEDEGLWKRQLGPNTCRYTDFSSLTCTSNHICTNIGDYRSCCEDNPAGCVASMKTACVNHVTSSAGVCDHIGRKTLSCGNLNNGFCGTYILVPSSSPGLHTQVLCATKPYIDTMYEGSSATSSAAGPIDTSSDRHANHQHEEPEPEGDGASGALIGG